MSGWGNDVGAKLRRPVYIYSSLINVETYTGPQLHGIFHAKLRHWRWSLVKGKRLKKSFFTLRKETLYAVKNGLKGGESDSGEAAT